MKILFMGRKKYSAEMLQWTVDMGQTIVGVVTDSHFSNSPTMIKAQQLGIPVISLEEAEQSFKNNSSYADLVISYLFWQKIREPLISTPKYGCINFHPALLPDWKGTAGYNVAILNKLPEWGATAHYVDENIDTGSIIRIFKFNFDYRFETSQTLEKKTQMIQCDLYCSVMKDLFEGKNLSENLIPNIGGKYISRKTMNEMKIVDPEKDDIELKCRAFWFPPYTGACIKLQGKWFTLIDDYILSQLKDKDQTSL